ncbi:MAG: hypothetical protein A3E78_07050 [Alphaproteobacteria bacterium RIFCSPHIGHO2_12_FULL_63_12]|nr:MAG: hypothetical protein A3E78_07050 [Alphaproteobacteria bacterium RIFCSPHIGHO2_12_FULL_63_12]
MTETLHATAVAIAVDADGPLAGVLILGGSGSGKSALALSLIETCPHQRTALVADDVVLVEAIGGRLLARAPPAIAGLIEVRGFGPVKARTIASVPLALAVDLEAPTERVPALERFVAAATGESIAIYPFVWAGVEATAPHRLRRMMATILGGQNPQRTQDRDPVQD